MSTLQQEKAQTAPNGVLILLVSAWNKMYLCGFSSLSFKGNCLQRSSCFSWAVVFYNYIIEIRFLFSEQSNRVTKLSILHITQRYTEFNRFIYCHNTEITCLNAIYIAIAFNLELTCTLSRCPGEIPDRSYSPAGGAQLANAKNPAVFAWIIPYRQSWN